MWEIFSGWPPRASSGLGLVAIVGALLACKEGGDGKCATDGDCKNGTLCESGSCVPKAVAEQVRGAKAAAPAATPAAPTAATPAATATAAPAAAPAATATSAKKTWALGSVPEIPSGRSNPPKLGEWDDGVVVNTQGANARGKNCFMMILREWLQITCRGNITGYEKMEDFGQKNVDYYSHIVPGKMASFVVRLRAGHHPKVRICRADNRASLFVNWPDSKDRPVHVALGHGPVCDGTDWGVGYGKKTDGSGAASAASEATSENDPEIAALKARDKEAYAACKAGDEGGCWYYCGQANCD
jgi:hypothetical protein